MALEERDAQLTPEALSELTGRPPEDFEAPDELPLPDLDELETHDADEFLSRGLNPPRSIEAVPPLKPF